MTVVKGILNALFIERTYPNQYVDVTTSILKTIGVFCIAALIAVLVLPISYIVHHIVNPYYPEGHPCSPHLGRDNDCELQVRQAVALETLAENLLYINVGEQLNGSS